MERGERVERGETAVASAAGDKECNKGRNESVRIRTKTNGRVNRANRRDRARGDRKGRESVEGKDNVERRQGKRWIEKGPVESNHTSRASGDHVFFLDFGFLCFVWILARRPQLDPRLLSGGVWLPAAYERL